MPSAPVFGRSITVPRRSSAVPYGGTIVVWVWVISMRVASLIVVFAVARYDRIKAMLVFRMNVVCMVPLVIVDVANVGPLDAVPVLGDVNSGLGLAVVRVKTAVAGLRRVRQTFGFRDLPLLGCWCIATPGMVVQRALGLLGIRAGLERGAVQVVVRIGRSKMSVGRSVEDAGIGHVHWLASVVLCNPIARLLECRDNRCVGSERMDSFGI